MEIIYSGICDVGLKRRVNQDAILMLYNREKEIGLFVVADGMGGHTEGELASHTITEELKRWGDTVSPAYYGKSFNRMMEALRIKLAEISSDIFHKFNQNQVCGSTCVLLFIYQNNYGVLNVGDSRIYKKKGLRAQSIMTDDVWENQSRVRDHLSEIQIAAHPNYGKLLQAVGTKQRLNVSMKTDYLKRGDTFLLCSDGLYKYSSTVDIEKSLKWMTETNIKKKSERLIAKVYENGAGDNVSVVLVKCL